MFLVSMNYYYHGMNLSLGERSHHIPLFHNRKKTRAEAEGAESLVPGGDSTLGQMAISLSPEGGGVEKGCWFFSCPPSGDW